VKRAAQAMRPLGSRAPSATYAVRFPKCQRRRSAAAKEPTAGRTPRVTRLLALAYRIDAMIRSGEVRDLADAARLVGVTRARMTQIANLLLLAPDIQDAILRLPPAPWGRDSIKEHELRQVIRRVDWREQRAAQQSREMGTCLPDLSNAEHTVSGRQPRTPL
jgi:hypothetical protein